eukprot:gnl/MRDRNA2_/MRDRNA2_122965_c0_seq1.p1 gnl/MRDRNA2_/MRDRNA2_122965_c0~~gnl/MRDRNA2_/MRDRNA2_122965_c0_seq1.p1  ORF type:complete len:520 (-),score=86.49 gnl/MRDRNA2_/MRDRNA2_122965_c0_seq1:58-1617(-)
MERSRSHASRLANLNNSAQQGTNVAHQWQAAKQGGQSCMQGPLTTMSSLRGTIGSSLGAGLSGLSSVPSPARLGGPHPDRGVVPLAVERSTQRPLHPSEFAVERSTQRPLHTTDLAGRGMAAERPGSASLRREENKENIATPSRWAWPFQSAGGINASETPPKEDVQQKYDKETPPKEVSSNRQKAAAQLQEKQSKDARASSQSSALNRPKAEKAFETLVAQFGLSREVCTPPGKAQISNQRPNQGTSASLSLSPEQGHGLPPPRLAALTDFSVTSPFLGTAAANASWDELPSSTRRALQFLQNCPRLPCTPCSGPGFLPPRKDPQWKARPTLVLDLDETLVHCSRGEKANERPGKTDVNMIVRFEDSPHDGRVRWRPFVELFLSVCSARFEIVIFTASDQGYADQVIDELDPHGYISHRLYRRHCTHSRGAFFKECGLLGRPQAKSILVDNSPISVACNPDNSILIKSWYGDAYDRELIDLLPILDQCIAKQDVTQYLSSRYGLREFFSSLGAQGRSD